MAAAVLIGLAVAGGWTALTAPVYEATAEAFVATRDGSGGGAAYQGGLFSQDRVKSYIELLDTPIILDPVRQKLGTSLSDDQLAAKISVSAPADTVIVRIKAKDESPVFAQQLANLVADEFASVVPSLESSGSGQASPVTVTIIRNAQVPTSPVSPRTKTNAILGLLGGLLLGVTAAAARERLGTAIRDDDDVLGAIGATPIANIPSDKSIRSRPLDVHSVVVSAQAEAFRRLRTNLQFIDVDNPLCSIAVTSAVAGDGKSTAACYLAASLAQAGEQVVLVEADLRKPVFSDCLGVEAASGLTSLLIGAAELDDVLQPWRDTGVEVLASGPIPPNPSELLGSRAMAELLQSLVARFDRVILDTPPLLPVADGSVVAALADGVLLVAGTKTTKRDHLLKSIGALRAVDARLLGVVLNRVLMKGLDSYTADYRRVAADRHASADDVSDGIRPSAPRRSAHRRTSQARSADQRDGYQSRPQEPPQEHAEADRDPRLIPTSPRYNPQPKDSSRPKVDSRPQTRRR